MSSKDGRLNETEIKVMRIMVSQAISMTLLAELTGIGQRRLRGIINHLILTHAVPILSSTQRKVSGYYICREKDEVRRFNRAFKRRAITGLLKAASVNRSSLLEVANRLAFDYYRVQTKKSEKIPGMTKVVNRYLQHIKANPKLYKREIQQLKEDFQRIL
jgi:hypothetical protein